MQSAEMVKYVESFAYHTRRVYRGENWREACAWIKGTNDLIRAQFNEKIFRALDNADHAQAPDMHAAPK
jgi:hypothetical protein